jgi:hypothetical protein
MLVKPPGQFVCIFTRIKFLSNQALNKWNNLGFVKFTSEQPQISLVKFTKLMNLDVHTITIKQE